MPYTVRPAQYIALFLFLFAVYLLTYTPRINSSDGLAMFSTAESLVRRGALDIEQIRWMDLQQGTYGLDGLLYSRKGIGVPIGLLLLTWLGLVTPWFGPVGVSLLFNAIVTALTTAVLLAYLCELGFHPRTGFIVALTFGLTTLAWPYAKSLFSDPFSGLLLLAAAYFLLKMSKGGISRGAEAQGSGGEKRSRGAEERRSKGEKISKGAEAQRSGGEKISRGARVQRGKGEKKISPAPLPPRFPAARHLPVSQQKFLTAAWSLRYPTLAGLCLGWNVATRYAEALFLPIFGLLLLYYLYKDYIALQKSQIPTVPSPSHIRHHILRFTSYVLRRHWATLTAFLTPILLVGLALIAFNISRYGDPLNTGYLPNETFSGILWQGILGQLISPGRGLLLFCPVFILSLWGFFPFFRRHRAEALTALSIIIIHLLLYGKWFMWHGGYAWGPRFMVPTLPFWAMLLAPIVSKAFPTSQPNRQPSLASEPSATLRTGSTDKQRSGGAGGQGRYFFLPCSSTSLLLRLIYFSLALLGLIPQLLGVSIHFSPFLDSLLETGLPLFAPETFFAWQYSPFFAAWRFIQPDTLDLAWAWQGQFNGWLLVLLLANIVINGLNLYREWPATNNELSTASSQSNFLAAVFRFLPYVSTTTALFFLLAHVHSLPAEPLQQTIASLNNAVRPGDAVITNDPDIATTFAELYGGRAPVLGLHHGGSLPADIHRRLEQTIAAHRQVWWLPNWLPPDQSAIEQTLLTNGFQARQKRFGDRRLLLFAFPERLAEAEVPAPATFDSAIALDTIAYPLNILAGKALPIELRWRGLQPVAEDYNVYIHLIDNQGQLVAQADGQPTHWTRPTSTWEVDETIVDRHGLWLPQTTAPGHYRLRVGLYQPDTGQRLRLPNGEDGVEFRFTIQ